MSAEDPLQRVDGCFKQFDQEVLNLKVCGSERWSEDSGALLYQESDNMQSLQPSIAAAFWHLTPSLGVAGAVCVSVCLFTHTHTQIYIYIYTYPICRTSFSAAVAAGIRAANTFSSSCRQPKWQQ